MRLMEDEDLRVRLGVFIWRSSVRYGGGEVTLSILEG